jgi:hypothetical protein
VQLAWSHADIAQRLYHRDAIFDKKVDDGGELGGAIDSVRETWPGHWLHGAAGPSPAGVGIECKLDPVAVVTSAPKRRGAKSSMNSFGRAKRHIDVLGVPIWKNAASFPADHPIASHFAAASFYLFRTFESFHDLAQVGASAQSIA